VHSLLSKHIDEPFAEGWLRALSYLRIVVVNPVRLLANVAYVVANMHTCAQVSNEALKFVAAICSIC
jgi:hypothetical protein